jgi:hypothetical protein
MADLHFQINSSPTKFFGPSDYFCKQARTDTAATPLGQDIKLF